MPFGTARACAAMAPAVRRGRPMRSARARRHVRLFALAELGPLPWSLPEPCDGVLGDLPAQPQRALDGDPLEAEGLVGKILTWSPSVKSAYSRVISAICSAQISLRLSPRRLAHLDPVLAGVDQLDLAPALGRLAVGHDPEVGGDPGVVEELVGQGDDGFEPVVLDDPAADLGLARASSAGEERASR